MKILRLKNVFLFRTDKSYMQNDDRTCQDANGSADSAFVCDPSGVSASVLNIRRDEILPVKMMRFFP